MEDSYLREVVPHGSRNVQPYPWLEISGLPRLPIPTIEETARRYIEYLEPLLADSPGDLERTKKHVAEFVKYDAEALQTALKGLEQISPTSWLEGWWDTGYVEFRVPSFINVNPFFIFKADPAQPPPVRSCRSSASFLLLSLPLPHLLSHAAIVDRSSGSDRGERAAVLP